MGYFVEPYRAGNVITWQGQWIQPREIHSIAISETDAAIEGVGGGYAAFNAFAYGRAQPNQRLHRGAARLCRAGTGG
jgi:hypothetical protein